MSDMTVDREYLVEALAENRADDPFSTATYVIRRVLEDVLDDGVTGTMNDKELEILQRLATNFAFVTGQEINPRPA
jgi:hypothetical protein